MEAWLRAVAASVPGPLRPAASIIINAILRVWQWSEGLGRRAATGWGRVFGAAVHLSRGVVRFGAEVYTTLRWLVLVRIPQAARNALVSAQRWAAPLILQARAFAAGLVAGLRTWAILQLRGLLTGLNGLRTWTVQRTNELRDLVRRLLGHVFGVLGTPTRLAGWIVAAMWTALWRYAWSNLDRLADALWARRRALLLRGAAEVERLIGRLL